MVVSFEKEKLPSGMLVTFHLAGALIPDDLKGLVPPDPVEGKFAHLGVILSGRGPVWLYGFLVHFYHPCRFVAVFDPRLQAAVVVEAHVPGINPGDLISISDSESTKNSTNDV